MPTTSALAVFASTAATPVPVPTSSTHAPGWTRASATRSRAGSASLDAWTLA